MTGPVASSYPVRRFEAVTTCPGCGTIGCFPWELPPPVETSPTMRALMHVRLREAVAYQAWQGGTVHVDRGAPMLLDADACDVVRQCPRCGAQWGEK